MRGAELTDEIDWLIHELKPNIRLSAEHYVSLKAVVVDCPHNIIGRLYYGGIIRTLKHKRDRLT